uniref:Uncharacterized protein n=1 Tax=Romanomermis culicivorax TaxID=13658 RepID=A0A915I9C9_ROMCU
MVNNLSKFYISTDHIFLIVFDLWIAREITVRRYLVVLLCKFCFFSSNLSFYFSDFFPLRKRCRRSTSQQRIKMIVDGQNDDKTTTTTYRTGKSTITAANRHHFCSLAMAPTTGSTANTTVPSS